MRYLAYLLTLCALAGAALAAQNLRQAIAAPVPPRAATAGDPAEAAAPSAATPEPQPPGQWPALFGTAEVPEPQPPAPPEPAVEPQPPAPPAPPLASLGYSLKGLVSSDNARWAIVSHPTGERLLRVGDELPDTPYTVTAIDVRGIWATSSPEGEPQLLGFDE